MNDEHDTVFMVDFSLQPYGDMGKLHRLLGDKLVWIHHHITAIEAVDPTIKGLRRNSIGACQLVWGIPAPQRTCSVRYTAAGSVRRLGPLES